MGHAYSPGSTMSPMLPLKPTHRVHGARVFTWIYDVTDVTLETDSSSTLVTLSKNSNSPDLSTGDCTDFFVGFDNIQAFIDAGTSLDYKIGVMPGTPDNIVCVMDAL